MSHPGIHHIKTQSAFNNAKQTLQQAAYHFLNLYCDSGGTCSEAEHKLFSVIFSSYNQYIRPVENVSDPVIVQFEVSMSQLVKVVSRPTTVAYYSALEK